MIDVWATRGTKFHSRADCESLLSGQDKAASEGKQTYPPVLKPVALVESVYDPCLTCWRQERGWFDGWLPVELKTEHTSGQQDGSDWEPIFLREVLEKLPSLRPGHVTAQDVVERPYGAPLRPDFTIRVPGWQRLAIEVDGDKERWYPDAVSREGVLARDDELEELGFRVVHFTNTEISQEPERCRSRLQRILDELERDASRSSMRPTAGTDPTPVPQRVNAPGVEGARSWKKWVVGVSAAFVIGAFVVQASGEGDVDGGVPPVSGQCDSDHPIKGNVAVDGESIYHEPGWEFYTRTTPEECFATSGGAEDAGFRASERQ